MNWLSQDEMIVLGRHACLRVLSVQPHTIRLSVESQSGLHVVPSQRRDDGSVRVTLATIQEDRAGLEVLGASTEPYCDESDDHDQMQTSRTCNFVNLRVGECVAFGRELGACGSDHRIK